MICQRTINTIVIQRDVFDKHNLSKPVQKHSMYLLQFLLNGFIDWKQVLLGDNNWKFLVETVFRTIMMFIIILTGLSILGKRGVRQLSVFELVVIIGLGSAAGDPMFYKDVGILPAFIVVGIIVGLYILVTYIVGKSKKFETLIEGNPICLVKEGRFAIDNFKKEHMAHDEFFAELRMQSVSQLGQIEQAIAETSGQISIMFYPDEEVRYGLSILPDSLKEKAEEIKEPGFYACAFCGNTKELKPAPAYTCKECQKKQWVKASKKKRVS